MSLYASYPVSFSSFLTSVQIVPLLSQSSHRLPENLTKSTIDGLINRIQFGGDEVVKAKDGTGSATLSMAYAGAEFAVKVIRAIKGDKDITVPSYVNLTADPEGGAALTKDLGKDLDYFSSPVVLGVSFVSFPIIYELLIDLYLR